MADITTFSRRTMLFLPLALAAACKRGASVIELTGPTMGTTYRVVAVHHTRALSDAQVRQAIDGALAHVNAQMSNWDAASEISRFNAARTTEPQPVSPEIAEVMHAADHVHRASAGQFDVTLGPLIELWGFGTDRTAGEAPSDAAIQAALGTAGQGSRLRVTDSTMQKTDPETTVFLSAIGKGYGVDQVARALASLGLRDFMVDIGGDLYTAGLNPDGTPWQIGVETPDAIVRDLQKVIGVSDAAMATSGDYRNYYEQDGVRYSHILDAETGRPITHRTASATVLAENAMLADAWATAMLTLGRDRGLEIAEAQDLAVLFLDRDGSGSKAGFVATASSRFAEAHA